MSYQEKLCGHFESPDGATASGAEQLRQLVELCRQQLGRDAPNTGVPLGVLAGDSLFVLSACRLAQTCSLLGDGSMARHLYQLLLPYHDRQITLTGAAGERSCAAAYFVGLVAANLANWDAAIEHFDHALQLNQQLGATYDAAQTRYAYASVLVVRGGSGDWEQARELLRETVDVLAARESGPARARVSRNGSPTHDTGAMAARYVFRADGDYWTLAYDSDPFHVRDVRGLHYIGRLLRQPHRDLHVLDLVASGIETTSGLERTDLPADGYSVARLDDVLPVLDPRARRAYVGRLRALRAEQDEAALNNDMGRSAALNREITFLTDQLLAASRPTRCASTASPVERARISVRNAITGALKVIAPHHGELARHLRNAIRTGSLCCYAPDRPVDWAL
jgi:tetratricopeptide (TPR) repeat protein